MTTDKTIILKTYNDIMEANIDKEKLKEAGVPSFMKNENVMGLDPMGGIELKIFEKDKEAAIRLLSKEE